MKRIVCCFLAATAALALNACAHPESKQPQKVLLILQTWSSAYTEDVVRGANEAANQYGLALTVKTVSSGDAAQQQESLLQSAAEQDFDAIILDPADVETAEKAMQYAQKRHIPVVSLNSGIKAGQACTVDTDKKSMAANVLSEARRLAGSGASVLVLNCLDEYDNTQRLSEVLRAGAAAFPDIKLTQIDFHMGQNVQLLNNYDAYLTTVKGDFAVIALNSYATVFASNQQKAAANNRKTALISFSQDKNAVSLLEQNRVDALCLCRNVNLGFSAVRQAFQCMSGGQAGDVMIPSELVTVQNLYSTGIQEILFPVS